MRYLIFLGLVLIACKSPRRAPELVAIDSLKQANLILEEKVRVLDSTRNSYDFALKELQWRLDEIEKKKKAVREYYHGQVQKPKSYNNSQLDSFFKHRYPN